MTRLEERDYTVAEVAAIFMVHQETVKLWLVGKQSEKMNGKKVMGKWMIPHTEITRVANLKYGAPDVKL
jgi:hypothetical protein